MNMKAYFKHWRKGDIILWYGAVADIRKGWALCNGSNGTPDLNGRAVVGAGVTYSVDTVLGAAEHQHDFTGSGHSHQIAAGPPNAIQSGSGYDNVMGSSQAWGLTETGVSYQPSLVLCFIMKL